MSILTTIGLSFLAWFVFSIFYFFVNRGRFWGSWYWFDQLAVLPLVVVGMTLGTISEKLKL